MKRTRNTTEPEAGEEEQSPISVTYYDDMYGSDAAPVKAPPPALERYKAFETRMRALLADFDDVVGYPLDPSMCDYVFVLREQRAEPETPQRERTLELVITNWIEAFVVDTLPLATVWRKWERNKGTSPQVALYLPANGTLRGHVFKLGNAECAALFDPSEPTATREYSFVTHADAHRYFLFTNPDGTGRTLPLPSEYRSRVDTAYEMEQQVYQALSRVASLAGERRRYENARELLAAYTPTTLPE